MHLSAFALSVDMSALTALQMAGLIGANLLLVAYVGLLLATGGRRTVHDFLVRTRVVRA